MEKSIDFEKQKAISLIAGQLLASQLSQIRVWEAGNDHENSGCPTRLAVFCADLATELWEACANGGTDRLLAEIERQTENPHAQMRHIEMAKRLAGRRGSR